MSQLMLRENWRLQSHLTQYLNRLRHLKYWVLDKNLGVWIAGVWYAIARDPCCHGEWFWCIIGSLMCFHFKAVLHICIVGS